MHNPPKVTCAVYSVKVGSVYTENCKILVLCFSFRGLHKHMNMSVKGQKRKIKLVDFSSDESEEEEIGKKVISDR